MNNVEKLKSLKDQYIELGKQEAGYLSTLQSLTKRKSDVTAKCKSLGIDPSTIDVIINEKTEKYNVLVAQIEEKLNPSFVPAISSVLLPIEEEDQLPLLEDDLPEDISFPSNVDCIEESI